MKIDCHLDWLTFSLEDISILPQYGLWSSVGEIPTSGLYKRAYRTKSGAIVRINDDDSSQKSLVILSGKAMEQHRQSSGGDRSVLNLAVDNCYNITRLDFAVDFHGFTFTPHDIRLAFTSGKIPTRAHDCVPIEKYNKRNDLKGQTCNIGSRTSDAMLRVYDKGKEMNLLNLAWQRAEMEWKSKKAHGIANAMRTRGIWRVGIANLLKFADISGVGDISPELAKVREFDEGDLVEIPRKETDFEKYLQGVYRAITKKYDTEKPTVLKFIEKLGNLLLEKGDIDE